MSTKPLISFIFPVYNEAFTLPELIKELALIRKSLHEKYLTEIIFVNDYSSDDSRDILESLCRKDTTLHLINFSRNFGHQVAITAGLEFARGDAVIIMDSDLQDPPPVALELIKQWETGFDVVYAKRRTRKDTMTKRFTAHIFYRLLDSLADIHIPKDTGDFRLLDRKVVDVLNSFREKHRYVRGLVSYIGFRQTAVLFDRSKRFAGSTNYSVDKMFKLAIDAITSFSTKLLTGILKIGLVMITIGLISLIFLTSAFISHTFIPLLPTLLIASVAFLLTGVQITMFGVLGSYIGRIYSEVQGRPLYIIESIYTKQSLQTVLSTAPNHTFDNYLSLKNF